MIKVKSITLNRAEGLTQECNHPVTTTTFQAADDILTKWGSTAPKDGGYDKVDFTIQWQDGEEYKGRFDMVYGGRESDGATLSKHISYFLTFQAGLRKPAHLTDERYQKYINLQVKENPNHIIEIKNWLEKYSLCD